MLQRALGPDTTAMRLDDALGDAIVTQKGGNGKEII